MGRWIVIISLAMAQWPGLAEATPPTTGIPLPKPRPVRRDPLPPPAARALAAPRLPWPVTESGVDEPQDEEAPPTDAPPQSSQPSDAETPAPAKPANGACNGGKRIMSAYYWQGSRTASAISWLSRSRSSFGNRLT